MPKITKEDLDTLIRLQEIQNEIKRLNKILDAVNGKQEKFDSELKNFQDLLAVQESEFSELRTRYKELEFEHQANESRIAKSRETLKVITTNKEYQVLLREIDDNVKKGSGMEDELLSLMEEVETAENSLRERQDELVMVSKRLSNEKNQLEKSCANDKEDLADQLEQLELVGERLDPKLMKRFKAIAADANGIAVVPVRDSVCMGCYMNVPPQINIEVKRGGTLIFCHQCHRILYWKAPEEVPAEAETAE